MKKLIAASTLVCANLLLGASGCIEAAPAADTEPPRLIGLGPTLDAKAVPARARLHVRFSEPIDEVAWRSDDAVVLVAGAVPPALLGDLQNPPSASPLVVPCAREAKGDDGIVLRPRFPLRANTTYSIVATKLVRDLAGNRLAQSPAVSTFETRGVGVTMVAPATAAPRDLKTLVLRYDAPPTRSAEALAVRLESPYGVLEALEPAEALTDPLLRAFRISWPLVPGADYRVAVLEGGLEAVLPLVVVESSEPVAPLPEGRAALTAFDGAVEASVSLDGAAFVRFWRGETAERLLPVGEVAFATRHQLSTTGERTGDKVYVRVELWTVNGETRFVPAADFPPLAAVVHPRLQLELNEVVTRAQRDWSDRTCPRGGRCGQPFDATPGPGRPSQTGNEWIELVNKGNAALDLLAGPAKWRLRVSDTTPEEIELDPARATLHFSAGSHARRFLPGGFLVVRPAGAINDDAKLTLVDPWGSVVGDLELGRGDVMTGRSTSTHDEAVARVGDTAGRWCRAAATPGKANAPCVAIGD